jgi:hypothetical protein
MLSSFQFDIYINALALASSQVLANFTAAFVISRFKRRLLSFACFGCTLLSSVALIFLWDQSEETESTLATDIAILILLFLFQLSIAKQYSVFYVFANEAFPTQARVIAISLVSLMGGLMATVTPLLGKQFSCDGCFFSNVRAVHSYSILHAINIQDCTKGSD